MLTTVIDLEYGAIPAQITLPDRYTQVLVLVRIDNLPVGQVYVPLHNGQIDGSDLQTQINQALGQPAGEAWIKTTLGLHEALPNTNDVSIVVATHDRPDDLRRCLQSLIALPDDGQEIVVVDYAPSNEQTRSLVATVPRIRYLRQEEFSLSAARNLALRQAQGTIVAFTTDDTQVDPGWLRALVRRFDDPLVACVTGLTIPHVLETEAHIAFEHWLSPIRTFERRTFFRSWYNPLHTNTIGSAANMAIRRHAWYEIGPFSTAFGVGSEVARGEDHVWFSQALSCGYKIVYDPAALVWHQHPATTTNLTATAYADGMGCAARTLHQLLLWREGQAVQSIVADLFSYALPHMVNGLTQQRNTLLATMMRAWIRGYLAGPRAYFAARQRIRRQGGEL